jgi:hypothetical protein
MGCVIIERLWAAVAGQTAALRAGDDVTAARRERSLAAPPVLAVARCGRSSETATERSG